MRFSSALSQSSKSEAVTSVSSYCLSRGIRRINLLCWVVVLEEGFVFNPKACKQPYVLDYLKHLLSVDNSIAIDMF
jgi:hypothetical protein